MNRRLKRCRDGRAVSSFHSLETLERRDLLAADLELLNDHYVVRQNQASVPFDVLANDSFADNYDGPRQVTSVSYGSEGGNIQLSEDRKTIHYAPPADFQGVEFFNYFVDGREFAQVKVTVEAPLESDEFQIPPNGQVHELEVLANDPFWPDYDGERRITLASVSSVGSEVTIAPDGRSILYTPSDEAYGSDQFVYIVDGIYPARVMIEVPPTTASDQYELLQNSTGKRLSVLANDPFWPGYAGDRTITSVTAPANGEVSIAATGQDVVYTPQSGFTGWDSFYYVVDDRFETMARVYVHRPVRNDWAELDRNSTNYLIDVLENDNYRDLRNVYRDNVNIVTSVTQPESGGTVRIVNGGRHLSYSPPQDFSGDDRFTYLADGRYEASVRLHVTRPVRGDYLSAIQDTPNVWLDVLANDFIGNGYDGRREITAVSTTEQEGIVANRVVGLAYTPPEGFVGSDQLSYTVDDDLSAQVSVYVRPLAQGDSYRECADPRDGAYTFSVMSNDLFTAGYQGPARITSVTSDDVDMQLSIAPNGRQVRFEPSQSGSSRFEYTVDGKYTANVSVYLESQLSGDRTVIDQNSKSVEINVLSNDFDRTNIHDSCRSAAYRGPRRITDVSTTTPGASVDIAADGKGVHYTPPADYFGTDTFSYEVDGLMTENVWVNVIRRVRDDQFRVEPGQQESLPLLVNDLFGADYTGPQKITDVTASKIGADIEVANDGRSIVYTATAGVTGLDTLTYTVDGRLKAEVEVDVRDASQTPYPRFGSLEDFEQFLLDDALERYESWFGMQTRNWFMEDASTGMGPPPGGPQTEAGGRDHSETNVQVEGVDENDIVEFDADYLYMLTGNDLVILDAWPAEELQEVSRHPIQGNPIGEFLKGDRLTVISEEQTFYPGFDIGMPFDGGVPVADDMMDVGMRDAPFWYPQPIEPKTYITVFDVSDRHAPQVVQTTQLEGQYIESRAVGDHVYLVLSNDAVAPPPEIILEDEENPWNGTYETREEYLERFRTETAAFVEDALPNYASYDREGELSRSGLVHQPEDIYQRLQQGTSTLLSLVSFDVTNAEPGLKASSGVYTRGAAKVYASLEDFYVFENVYDDEDGTSTRILKFDWDGATGETDFVAAGRVAGWMLNQFSADVHEGHLRIATTLTNSRSGNWTSRAENDLFVLREDGGVFEFVGSLQNLALEETIRSVRFMGDRAFLVTFRDVDPLFGLDVSDPTEPRALGHLTLPGFSSYMQLIDDEHLLAVGRNTPTGRSGPAQVSLFNVSDLTSPVLVDEYTFERFSTTEAAVDHHAFGYFGTHGLFAVPASQQYVRRVDTDGDGFRETREWVHENELTVFQVDVNAPAGANLNLAAQISHDSPVRRSGYIGDKLYSVAENSVSVVDVTQPDVILKTVTDLLRLEDEPAVPPPMLEEDAVAALELSQRDLAARLAVDQGQVLPVSIEPSDDDWQLVFRVDSQQYLYRASPGSTKLIDENFEFDDHTSVVWTNPEDPYDVNGDGQLAPNDAIWIINELNASGSQPLPNETVLRQISHPPDQQPYLDVSGDRHISPLDALMVIQQLNQILPVTRVDLTGVDLGDESNNSTEVIDRVFAAILSTTGDSNLDGRFDSSDLVRIFQAGEYEDGIPFNSTWAEGDWNGDREFSTADLVFAFKYGNYDGVAAAVLALDDEFDD